MFLQNEVKPRLPGALSCSDKRISDIVNYNLNRTQMMFKYEGGSASLPFWRIEQLLQTNGFGFITPHKGQLEFLIGTFGGKPDSLYLPTEFVFANPALEWSDHLPVDDGVIMRNDHNNMGLLPLFEHYATIMQQTEVSLYIANINSRMTTLLSAGNDGDALALNHFLKDLEEGKLGAVMSSNIINQVKAQPLSGSTTSITDLIELLQYCKASAFNEIGLDANYNMKREALSISESQMNNDALLPLAQDMLECRKQAVEEINEKFSEYLELGELTVDFNSSWKANETAQEQIIEGEMQEEGVDENNENNENNENEPEEKEEDENEHAD